MLKIALGTLCAKELNIYVNIATLQNAPVQIALQSIILFRNHDCGSDEDDNLALACRRCNERRYNFTTGVDPQTQQRVFLFNPHREKEKSCNQKFLPREFSPCC